MVVTKLSEVEKIHVFAKRFSQTLGDAEEAESRDVGGDQKINVAFFGGTALGIRAEENCVFDVVFREYLTADGADPFCGKNAVLLVQGHVAFQCGEH